MSEKEIWKDIEGYEGLYQVSNMGRVRSLAHKDKYGRFTNGRTLVATTFIPNQNGYPAINHRDENPSNNRVENIEWCTVLYNNRYGTHGKRIAEALERPIYAITSSGHRYFFSSATKAAELLGLSRGNVSTCLHGKRKHCHGFSFEWAGDPDD